MKIDSIGIVGAGAFGTALAQTLAGAGRSVILWAHTPATADEINMQHTNGVFLPGIVLNPAIRATATIAETAAADAILLVPPAQHMREIAAQLYPYVRDGQPVVICSKGIEQASGLPLGDVLAATLPQALPAVLTGPGFASDIARGLPAALTLACGNEDAGQMLAQRLSSRTFRLYWSSDMIGAELGGAVKNVLAIAAGIVDGKQLGASAHAGLVTRGFAELRRFGAALGAQPETLMGLSGLGDLLLTCGSPQSRNMSLGRALGQGQALADVLGGRRSVAEGVHTAGAVARVARDRGIDMPISFAVAAIVAGEISVDEAIEALLTRPLRAEG